MLPAICLLIQAAQRMKSGVREVGTVARLGGDECAIVVGDLLDDKAEEKNMHSSLQT